MASGSAATLGVDKRDSVVFAKFRRLQLVQHARSNSQCICCGLLVYHHTSHFVVDLNLEDGWEGSGQ
jgi:hypothetical protein